MPHLGRGKQIICHSYKWKIHSEKRHSLEERLKRSYFTYLLYSLTLLGLGNTYCVELTHDIIPFYFGV